MSGSNEEAELSVLSSLSVSPNMEPSLPSKLFLTPPPIVAIAGLPTTFPAITASVPVVRLFIFELMCAEHFHWWALEPDIIRDTYVHWRGDGTMLRTANLDHYVLMMHCPTVYALTIKVHIDELLRKEEMEQAETDAKKVYLSALFGIHGLIGLQAKSLAIAKKVDTIAVADATIVGCGCHGPCLELDGIPTAWRGLTNVFIQLETMGVPISTAYVGGQYVRRRWL
ncbi:hypothetical protein FN846DRAFT_911412 [Sphaerosporella brunnea]|uniref:Uncharacterized protein n=1 Tax=Sphaerosporella brunnea TaxID=1250544 RepID=A0A5J5EKR1_9PEZI|nr:hypothetical protein FN846DRAFT_911412 [Sphaerosporella brunnea]